MVFKIAVDAMGGDFAPEEIIKGVENARDRFDDVEFLLFGDSKKIDKLIQNHERLTITPTTEIIAMGDEPVKAMRTKKDSSMVRAAKSVKDGQAQALFSAGNTGALLASAIFIVGRIKNIDRPALLAALPTVAGKHDNFVMMDLGANAENKPSHLFQYGLLGSFYAEHILHIKKPVVKLLNNGAEEDKGDAVHKSAHQLLKKTKQIKFMGNIESRELLQGAADVVVTDGFTGNATLKAFEGAVNAMISLIKNSVTTGSLTTKMGGVLIRPALRDVQKKLDYNQVGGAVILGVNAPVVKAHGESKEIAVSNALAQTREMLKTHLVEDTKKYVQGHTKQIMAAKEFDDFS